MMVYGGKVSEYPFAQPNRGEKLHYLQASQAFGISLNWLESSLEKFHFVITLRVTVLEKCLNVINRLYE